MKIFTIVLTLLLPVTIFSQTIFQPISFAEAVKRSKETGKLIFIQFEAANCSHCNEVADKAFKDKELSVRLEQAFICIKISKSHADRKQINFLYNIKENFGSFFIDHNKTLIHSFRKSTTRIIDYKNEIDLAVYKSGEDIRLGELENLYNNGNNSLDMLELLLWRRKSLNLEIDSLLEKYVLILPPDSLKSIPKLVFIAQMAPVIGSIPYIQLRKDQELFTKAWSSLKLSDRMAINNRIINKSMQKAIMDKNEPFAYKVASFVQSTYSDDLQTGKKYYAFNILKFYKETNDTLNYQVRAINYYDKYYMSIAVDSIKKIDSVRRILQLNNQKAAAINKEPVVINKADSGSFGQRKIVQFAYSPITQNYTSELNKAAWGFYNMFNDSLNIAKAVMWSKRANEFYETPEAMDTYARLLYKSGNKKDAITWVEKAIVLKKKRGFPVTELEKMLENIRQDKKNIDN